MATQTANYTSTAIAPAQTWDVDDKQTVAGQVKGLIDANSPLMQQAETAGLQYANKRGLMNSSLGAQAAQESVLRAATPIAAADASTNANAGQFNANAANSVTAANAAAANRASEFNTGAQNTGFLADQQQENTQANLNLQSSLDAAKSATLQGYTQSNMDKAFAQDQAALQAKFGNDKELMAMQQTAAQDIAGIEAQYKNLTQASSSAASIANNTATMVNNILLNEKLDATAKQSAIDQVKSNMQTSLAMIGALAGDVDLSSFFDEIMSTP